MRSITVLAIAVLAMGSLPAFAQQDTNLASSLKNGGFESPSIINGATDGSEPEGWFFFCSDATRLIGITDQRKRSGMQSLRLKAQTPADAYEGMAQKFSAMAGNRYTFGGWVLNDPQDPISASSYGQVSIEWQTADGVEVAREYSAPWGADTSSRNWERHTVESIAPTNAAVGVAVITFFAKDAAGSGTFYMDECTLDRR